MADRLQKLIGRIEALPTLPAIIARINELIEDPRASAGDINEVISRDLALSSKLLKLVNSAFYGFPRRISSITHAVVILGFSAVRDITLSAFVFDAFDARKLPFGRRNFWIHSLGTAVAADVLAIRRGATPGEEAFVAGLLHDVGKVVMHQHMPEDFARVMERLAAAGGTFLEAERAVLDTDHAEIGGLLAEHWKLPERLVLALRCHHRPELAPEDRRVPVAEIHLADALARALLIGSGGDEGIPELSAPAWALLGLSPADLPGIMVEISTELEKAGAFLELIRSG